MIARQQKRCDHANPWAIPSKKYCAALEYSMADQGCCFFVVFLSTWYMPFTNATEDEPGRSSMSPPSKTGVVVDGGR